MKTDPEDKRWFPPRKVSADVQRATEQLPGARVRQARITDVDGWLELELHNPYADEAGCTVLVNPTDIRFRHP